MDQSKTIITQKVFLAELIVLVYFTCQDCFLIKIEVKSSKAYFGPTVTFVY